MKLLKDAFRLLPVPVLIFLVVSASVSDVKADNYLSVKSFIERQELVADRTVAFTGNTSTETIAQRHNYFAYHDYSDDYSSGYSGYKSGKVLSTGVGLLQPGVLNFEYESASSDSASTSFRFIYGDEKSSDWKWTGIGGGISFRAYPGNKAPSGGYAGIGLDAYNISAKYGVSGKDTSTFYAPQFEFGYQYVADCGFAFAVGGGIGMMLGSMAVLGEEIPLSGLYLGIRLAVGYGW